MFDLLRFALRNIGRQRLRAGMTISGIAIGIGSVILIFSIGLSGRTAITQQLNGLGLNGLSVQPGSAAAAAAAGTLTDADVAISRKVRGVRLAMPLIMQLGAAQLRNVQKQALIWGIGAQAVQMQTVRLLHGNMITEDDVENAAAVCLVEDSFARAAYRRSNIVGKQLTVYVNGESETLTVKGVVANGSGVFYNLVGSYIPSFVYTPYTTVGSLRGTDGYDQIALQTDTDADADAVGTRVVAALKQQGAGESYTVMNLFKQKQQITQVMDIITLIISAVGGVSLVVAGLGIMTVMTVSVSERTGEIGLKKAVGAPNRSILMEFLFEALGLSLIGGAAGIGGGLVLAFAAAQAMGLPFLLSVRALAGASLLSVAEGVLFGVYPAVKAARLSPVDALRTE